MRKKPSDILNDSYTEVVNRELFIQFGDLGFETKYHIWGAGVVTTWKKKVTPKKRVQIKAWLNAFGQGYGKAMDVLCLWPNPSAKPGERKTGC